MKKNKIFESVSFHIVKPCNMKCKFCYATFNDINASKQLTQDETYRILRKLANAGVEKITFAGGEPMLYKSLSNCISYAKMIGLTTSIITNGSFLTKEWIHKHKFDLDWIGISVDSLNPETNKLIGRVNTLNPNYYNLIEMIHDSKIKLKINTVVNRYNEEENMQEFINFADPDRWKIFDTLKVEGQNDKQFSEIHSTYGAFETFVKNHFHRNMVVENNEAMTGSYLLIDPLGRLFENSAGKHTYSRTLLGNDINDCFADININREMFIKRGGIYDWK